MVGNADIERSAGKKIETSYFSLAYNDVPFYRELPKKHDLADKDIQSVSDLSKLPVVDKAMVRRNWDRFINQNLKMNSRINSYTSCSIGMPMHFLLSCEQESWR